jgi:hypothetical protein
MYGDLGHRQKIYAGSPQLGHSEMYGGHAGTEMYAGMLPQEMGGRTSAMGYARPYDGGYQQ